MNQSNHEADSGKLSGYPVFPGSVPTTVAAAGRYVLRFARTPEDLDRIQKLRFQVFNMELGEGLDESFLTGRDRDELDGVFHHLIIESAVTGDVVGTYRMQTSEMAEAFGGYYSSGEFDLSGLPGEVLADSVEIGRACVAAEHRNGRVLHLLWRGLAEYLTWNGKRYLFGCCSLPGQDQSLGTTTYQYIRDAGYLSPVLAVSPLPDTECVGSTEACDVAQLIPPLFRSYLELGARVLGPPAIDRLFKTIDFFVVLDVEELDPRTHRTFFRNVVGARIAG